MNDFKISIITVVYNAEDTISKCIESVVGQKYKNIEYIIIDGASTDSTIEIITKYQHSITSFISEKDNGIYDAMNKGIKLATGEIVGMLNADDMLADRTVITEVAAAFEKNDAEIVYGDLEFINNQDKVVRKWSAGQYKQGKFNWGWMPPHPTFYCKRTVFNKFGFYRLDFGSAADYELMLRFMHLNGVKAHYLKRLIVKMLIGGISNKNLASRVKVSGFDLKAMKKNKIFSPRLTIILKPLRKIFQFI